MRARCQALLIPTAFATVFATVLATALAAGPAGAQDHGGLLLVVAVDDRGNGALVAPALQVDLEGMPRRTMLDDGSLVGDVPGDRIWMAAESIPRSPTVRLALLDGEVQLTTVEVVLPEGERAFFAYKLTPDRTLAPDPGARAIQGVGDPVGGASGPLIVQAAPVATEDSTLEADQVRVRVVLDDRAAERVTAPRVVISQDGIEPLVLTDDGTVAGDTVADAIWMGDVVVRRTQYLTFSVQEKEAPLADLTVFLPSTGQAAVSLRTTEGDPAVELSAEPVATGGTQGPEAAPASGGGGGSSVDVDRLSYVLWTGVAMFAIAFAYVRAVVWRAWREEVRPVVQKLDRHLDARRQDQEPGA